MTLGGASPRFARRVGFIARAAARADAIRFYRMALEMRPADADIERINTFRYYLTFLYYTSGDLHESAVMGNFLAKNYPAGPGARQGAKIAMTAWLSLYNDARAAFNKAVELTREIMKPKKPAAGAMKTFRGIEFVWVPSGTFTMGSAKGGDRDEKDFHDVRISEGFWMGKCEVTQEQWKQVMGTAPWLKKNHRPEDGEHQQR